MYDTSRRQAFEELQKQRFDLIVLDPPKFAPSLHHVDKAARAYKEINLKALRLLAHASSQWFPGVAGLLLPMGQVVFGALIIGFLVFEPHGLAAIWARIRRTFHLWPFKT
mgnify:CR=1 FL=1